MTRIFKDPIFNFAIFISVTWHIFWICMISVVVTPKEASPIKFSKVSFLGPILERGVLEVKIRPRERSLLEKRYISEIKKLNEGKIAQPAGETDWSIKGWDAKVSDIALTHLIEEALNGSKVEPR